LKSKKTEKIFLGISIFKPRFNKKSSLSKDISLLTARWHKPTIIIADLPEIINLMTMSKMSFDLAKMKAISHGEHIKSLLTDFKDDITVMTWENIESKIPPYLCKIQKYREGCKTFNDLLLTTVEKNLYPRYGKLEEKVLSQLSEYLLVELAQTIYFNLDLNISVEVYPGALPEVKKHIAIAFNLSYSYYDIRNRKISLKYSNRKQITK